MKRRSLAVALALLTATPASAVVPAPAGADHAMVVTAQHLASDVGRDVLRAGGNVVDAAVAVGYALAVVWPGAGNLGGGGFMTVRLADGRETFLDFREKAAAAATPTMFLAPDGTVVPGRSTDSWLAVGVPGSVAGLEWAREHFGSLPRATLMAPAIRLAREGFILADADVTLLDYAAPDFAKDPATAAIFLRNDQPLAAGDRLVQPHLATTLQRIADNGVAGFYGGPVAEAIAAASRAGGGILAEADLAAYRPRTLDPLHCTYRGFAIQSAPPPSAGGIALCEMLNILEGYDIARMGYGSAAASHVAIEAMRRAFRDRQGLGDPAFHVNDTARLLDKAYAAKLRDGIDASRATPSSALATPVAKPEGQQTTHYSVADAAGNAVSVTTTLNSFFGLRRVAGDTGVLMNNEMDDFAAKPGVSNQFGLVGAAANDIAPGKTPLSSMSPTIVTRDGRLALVLGSPGGSRIPTTVLQTILNVVDHGMTIRAAIDAPRLHMQWQPDVVEIEPGALSPDTRHLLEEAGYAFKEAPPWGQVAGIATAATARPAQSGGSLAIPFLARTPQPFALTGANDDRDPVGSASGF